MTRTTENTDQLLANTHLYVGTEDINGEPSPYTGLACLPIPGTAGMACKGEALVLGVSGHELAARCQATCSHGYQYSAADMREWMGLQLADCYYSPRAMALLQRAQAERPQQQLFLVPYYSDSDLVPLTAASVAEQAEARYPELAQPGDAVLATPKQATYSSIGTLAAVGDDGEPAQVIVNGIVYRVPDQADVYMGATDDDGNYDQRVAAAREAEASTATLRANMRQVNRERDLQYAVDHGTDTAADVPADGSTLTGEQLVNILATAAELLPTIASDHVAETLAELAEDFGGVLNDALVVALDLGVMQAPRRRDK